MSQTRYVTVTKFCLSYALDRAPPPCGSLENYLLSQTSVNRRTRCVTVTKFCLWSRPTTMPCNRSGDGLLLEPAINGHFFTSSLLQWRVLSSKNCANFLFYADRLQQIMRISRGFRVFFSHSAINILLVHPLNGHQCPRVRFSIFY